MYYFECVDAGRVARGGAPVDGGEGTGGVVGCCVVADGLGGEAWGVWWKGAVDFGGDGDWIFVGGLGLVMLARCNNPFKMALKELVVFF